MVVREAPDLKPLNVGVIVLYYVVKWKR